VFASTSKITLAGGGVSFFGASPANIAWYRLHAGVQTIGPDKVNQLRHIRLTPDFDALTAQMRKHAALLKPRFDTVLRHLDESLAGSGMGDWTAPKGGYFISFNTLPGLAREVVKLAANAGVKLTPAGATWPYGKDPENKNIRIAPSFPSTEEVDRAMQVFVLCVQLASVRKKLSQ